ncbi:MAG: hypothetical protein LBI03_10905, partial [Clostridiales bacterium]|nr:hypothetical protein [Clostridiales bacterium]
MLILSGKKINHAITEYEGKPLQCDSILYVSVPYCPGIKKFPVGIISIIFWGCVIAGFALQFWNNDFLIEGVAISGIGAGIAAALWWGNKIQSAVLTLHNETI